MPRARSSNSMGLQEEHLFYGTRSKDSRNARPMHFQEGSLQSLAFFWSFQIEFDASANPEESALRWKSVIVCTMSNPSSTVNAEKRGVLRGKAFSKSQNVVPNANTIARFLLALLTAIAYLRRGKERRSCIFESNAPALMPTCKSWRASATTARCISGS